MSHDTLMHRGLRPVLRPLAGTRITPDMLTACRLLTGIAAAAAIASGVRAWQDVGGAIFILSMLLDRADGELARQTGRFSRFGGRFDLVSDCSATALAFAALGLGFRPGWLPVWQAAILGLAGAAGIVALFARLHVMPPTLGGLGPGPMPRRPFDPDDSLLMLPVMIWCGAGQVMLFLTAFGTPLAALLVWIVPWLRTRTPSQAASRVASSARSASSSASHSASVPTVMRR
ncbi:MAG: CDP-alcohol phosphatidyltransferase family protein [Gluconacetobacter diazotrophicus]|nr:CDP-alcohol phosphatidyltransferase family protein [Gluconacetobacter diazotrophicus]